MADVIFDKVNKVYDNGFHAVQDLSLDVADGEFLVLVGPSGCGKTTALRMIAGLEDITSGEMRIGGKVVNRTPSKDRDIAMVFQSYALYPHMTVAENIGYGLRIRKTPKDEIDRLVKEAAARLDLTEYLDRRPKQLSGGQRQRVAMGRAIVRRPQVFLMDEPLSNLDAKLRGQMRTEIAGLQQDLGTTTIYVTHDQVEAMTMGDRIALMKKGVLQQIAEPQTMYDFPDNIFVAGFIGSPTMNMAEVPLTRDGNTYSIAVGSQTLSLSPAAVAAHPRIADYVGRTVVVGIRHEDMEDYRVRQGESITATAGLVEALGSELQVYFDVDAPAPHTEDVAALQDDKKDPAAVTPKSSANRWVAGFAPAARTRPGDEIRVTIDTDRLHFFDPETSAAIRV